MRKPVLWLLLAGLLCSSAAMELSGQENRLALVIGNGAYTGSAALKNPVNDANSVAASLGRLGWQVTLLTNADRRQMTRTISAFRDAAAAKDAASLLFYYAGHGMQIDGINYLIPVHADFETIDDVKNDAVSLGLVTQAIDEAKASVSLLVLDACRDNPFARTGSRSLGGSRGLSVLQSGGGTQGSAIMFSTAPGDVAQDGTGSNGVFTAAFLKNMESNLRLEDMFRAVTAEVRKVTSDSQKPWINASLSTDFYMMSEALRNVKVAAEKAAEDQKRAEELAKATAEVRRTEAARTADILRRAEDAKKAAELAVSQALSAKDKAETEAAQKAAVTMKQLEEVRLAAEKAVREATAAKDKAEAAAKQNVSENAKANQAAQQAEAARMAEMLRSAEESRRVAEQAVAQAQDAKAKAETEAARIAAASLKQAEDMKLAAEKAIRDAQAEKAKVEADARQKAQEVAVSLEKAQAELARLTELAQKSQSAVFASLKLGIAGQQAGSPRIRARQVLPVYKEKIASLLATGAVADLKLDESGYYNGDPLNIQAGTSTLGPGDWLLTARLDGDDEDTFVRLVPLEAGKKLDLTLPRIEYSLPYQINQATLRRNLIAPLVETAQGAKSFNDFIGTATGIGAAVIAGLAAFQTINAYISPETKAYLQLSSPKAISDWKVLGRNGSTATFEFSFYLIGTLGLSLGAISLIEALSPVPNIQLVPELEKLDIFLATAKKSAK